MAIYMMREAKSILDEVTWNSYSSTSASGYRRGITITPKINCSLDKVVFVNHMPISWTLRIWEWEFWNTGTYTVTLDTSNTVWWVYDTTSLWITLTTGVTYGIKFNWDTMYYSNSWVSMPKEWTNITIEQCFDTRVTRYTTEIFAISWVYTTAS
jgi:hypothetical protein